MFHLSDFYNYCKENDVDVIPYKNAPSVGTTMRDGTDYAIFIDFSALHSVRLLRGVCAHELGHVATGALHKVASPYETWERSEYRANRWATQHFLPVEEFQAAFAQGYTEVWQLADWFNLPEDDIKKALAYWTECKDVNFNRIEQKG